MGPTKNNVDPVTARARDLNAEIAALEAQIQKLNTSLGKPGTPGRFRSTALPEGPSVSHRPAPAEPVFEDVNQDRLKAKAEHVAPPEHFNDLGVRKYDLSGLLDRVKGQFRGPVSDNPRFVNYLAAGSVQGLRPLRYEKRVARNRFIVFVAFLLLLLIGLLAMVMKNH